MGIVRMLWQRHMETTEIHVDIVEIECKDMVEYTEIYKDIMRDVIGIW